MQTNYPASIIAYGFGMVAFIGFVILVLIAKFRLPFFTKFDNTLTHFVHKFHPRGEKFFIAVDTIGNILGLMLLVACLLGTLYLHDYKVDAWWLGINTVAITVIINPLLKLIIHRQRPQVKHLVHAFGYSFPSGHASGVMVIFGTLMVIICGLNLPLGWFIGSQLLCVLLILIIGFSRIYLGVHYTTDVLAGYLEGIAWIGLTYPIFIHYLSH